MRHISFINKIAKKTKRNAKVDDFVLGTITWS